VYIVILSFIISSNYTRYCFPPPFFFKHIPYNPIDYYYIH